MPGDSASCYQLGFELKAVGTAPTAGLDTATFNVYFWYPNNSNEQYLGIAKGLDQCGAMASSHANSKNLSRGDGWSYICCLKTSSSECAEKHR